MFSVLKLDPTHFALTLLLYFWRILIYISWGCHHTSNIWSRQLVSRKCLKFYSPLWSHPIPWNRDLNELQLTLPLDDISTHDSAFLADRFLIYIFQCKQSTPHCGLTLTISMRIFEEKYQQIFDNLNYLPW